MSKTRKIGYARVSTTTQNLSLQIDLLTDAGCDLVFSDSGIPGNSKKRPGLEAALCEVSAGDTLLVVKLDRLARSLSYLIELINKLGDRGVQFSSVFDGIDTTTSSGKLVFHLLGALAEFERELLVERTVVGMAAARRRGKHIGRPNALSKEQVIHARRAIENGHETLGGMASVLGVHRNTLTRALKAKL